MIQQSSTPEFSRKAGPVYLQASSQLHLHKTTKPSLKIHFLVITRPFNCHYKNNNTMLLMNQQLKWLLEKMIQQLPPLQPLSCKCIQWTGQQMCTRSSQYLKHSLKCGYKSRVYPITKVYFYPVNVKHRGCLPLGTFSPCSPQY